MILWWLAMSVQAADEAPEDFRGYVDQARFFIRQAWYPDARQQLERAVATPDGRLDPDAWMLLAQVCYELADGAAARHAADRAHVNSRTEAQAAQAAALRDWIDTHLGWLEIHDASGPTHTRIRLQAEHPLIDPQIKAYFDKVQERLRGPVRLPMTLGLPAGSYSLQGETVQVQAGAQNTHTLQRRVGPRGVEVELGLGMLAWIGHSHTPAPTTGLAVTIPMGPLIFGAMGDWSYQPYRTRNHAIYASADGWSAGVRVGLEVPGTAPLLLRGSVGARLTRLPGLELTCTPDEGPWACAGDTPPRDLHVYTGAVGVGPLIELSALYLDRGKRQGLGGGVKVSGEQLWGQLPASGTAEAASGASYAWTSDSEGWQALGVRAMAHLVYSF